MSTNRPTTDRAAVILAMLTVAAALAIAGCGGGDDSGPEARGYGGGASTEGDVTAPPNAEEGTVFVSVASVDDLGLILADSRGHTLYEFRRDRGTTSSCYGPCAQAWPPLLTEGAPQPSNGADGSLLGTTKRKDGSEQVTYAGHPLYAYTGDKAPGEANGNDVEAFGAEWYALTPTGSEPEDGGESQAPPPPTSY